MTVYVVAEILGGNISSGAAWPSEEEARGAADELAMENGYSSAEEAQDARDGHEIAVFPCEVQEKAGKSKEKWPFGTCPFDNALCNSGSGCQLFHENEGMCLFWLMQHELQRIADALNHSREG